MKDELEKWLAPFIANPVCACDKGALDKRRKTTDSKKVSKRRRLHGEHSSIVRKLCASADYEIIKRGVCGIIRTVATKFASTTPLNFCNRAGKAIASGGFWQQQEAIRFGGFETLIILQASLPKYTSARGRQRIHTLDFA